MVGKDVGKGVGGSQVGHHAQDLRDHVAGALQPHGVADADIEALDFVLVVQGGVANHDPAHRHRMEPGHGGQGAGATDLDVDAFQHRCRLLGGEFVGDGPARTAGDEA